MKRFKNILVGVDLSAADRFVSEDLTAPNQEAIEQALWLAVHNSASLMFLNTLEVSASTERLIEQSPESEPGVLNDARQILSGLVQRAEKLGIQAQCQAMFGKSWVQTIRRVIESKHDLVVVGTRERGHMTRILLGSTGMKLLRKCPCPVWVTKPRPDHQPHNILVAHDLTEVGQLALELGQSMSAMRGAQLHVIHAVNSREKDLLFPTQSTPGNHDQMVADAKQRLSRELGSLTLTPKAQLHLSEEDPESAILEAISRLSIDLLVMGTIKHCDIPGMFLGTTAERILPQIPCSILGVKPANFVSPIRVD